MSHYLTKVFDKLTETQCSLFLSSSSNSRLFCFNYLCSMGQCYTILAFLSVFRLGFELNNYRVILRIHFVQHFFQFHDYSGVSEEVNSIGLVFPVPRNSCLFKCRPCKTINMFKNPLCPEHRMQ